MKRNQERSAFTLVEMLVAMALILFIMVIISQCFATALETFRQLKGIGDMQESLRTASTRLRADLMEDHFEGKRKLSDPGLLNERPREGFFYLQIGPNRLAANPNTTEGYDGDNMPSYRGPLPGGISDSMYFTIKMRGNRREHVMSTKLPAGYATSPLLSSGVNFFGQNLDAVFNPNPTVDLTFNSQWAEVAWYLQRTGSTIEQVTPTSTLGTPLYALYRDQYLLVPNVAGLNANTNGTTDSTTLINPPYAYSGVSCYPNPPAPPGKTLAFNSPSDVTDPANRCRTKRAQMLAPVYNPTLVLSNVVSFQVRLMPLGSTATSDFTGDYWSMDPTNKTPPYKEFDAATTTTGIRALQIIIRVWDPASEQTRQVSIVQDM